MDELPAPTRRHQARDRTNLSRTRSGVRAGVGASRTLSRVSRSSSTLFRCDGAMAALYRAIALIRASVSPSPTPPRGGPRRATSPGPPAGTAGRTATPGALRRTVHACRYCACSSMPQCACEARGSIQRADSIEDHHLTGDVTPACLGAGLSTPRRGLRIRVIGLDCDPHEAQSS